jgi:CubicO group peptidase (beta-lactamase class C family)
MRARARTWVLLPALALFPAATKAADPDRQALLDELTELVEASPLAGAAVAVVGRQGTWTAGIGQAAREERRPMTSETLFRVGSVSKSFVALAVMRLCEQGRLRLEDRVRDLLPEVAIENAWEKTHPLQLAHLLEHTSGFDEMRFNEVIAPDQREDRPLAEVLAVNPRSRVTRWPPGTRFSYSQPGYTVAAAILEKVTGLRYEQVLETEVFRPLGIRGAALARDPAVRARLAVGYERGRPAPYINVLHRPAGNLMISAADLGRLVAMLLGRGELEGRRFLQPASVERIERSGTLPYGPDAVRYGLGNWGDVSMRLPMRGHGGWMPGYQTIYRYSPSRGLGYVLLINDSRGGRPQRQLNEALFDHLLAGDAPPPPPRIELPIEALDQYVGYYRLASPGIELLRFRTDLYGGLTVRRLGNGLVFDLPGGVSMRAVASGPDRFRYTRQSESSIQFLRGEGGRRAVVIQQDYYEQASAAWASLRRGAIELSLMLLASTALVPLLLLALAVGPRPGAYEAGQAGLLLRPLLAALCLWGTATSFEFALDHGTVGTRNGATVLVWLLSWGFAIAAHSSLQRAVTSCIRGRRAGANPWLLTYALTTSAACCLLALYLSHYGLIGLRTWRW